MPRLLNQFARAETVLNSAVANSGTFTVAYPAGSVQRDFLSGLARPSGHYMIVNDNDRWTAAASQMSVAFGASDITVTNSSGTTLPAGSRVAVFFDQVDGNERDIFSFPVTLPSIANGEVVTEFQPGIDGTIEAFWFITEVAATTASRTATLNLEIGTTNLTGGVLTLTSAAATPKGRVIEATAITGANVLTRASLVSIEAASVTAFAEGSGTLYIAVRRTPSPEL
jgi:hypothetical protein